MKEINISTILLKRRREKGITQDELANYIGISKAAISKWETGQSYPDITLLPVLAAYFNMSLDELMGYEPQMKKEDIKKLYQKLCQSFVSEEFDSVIIECKAIIKKYYSCFPLLFQMGVLLVNHVMLAGEPKKVMKLYEEARLLFRRIQEESIDVDLVSQAKHLEAVCLITLNQPSEALVLLEGTNKPKLSGGVLQATAYQMIGNKDQAITTLQIEMYQNIMITIGAYPSLLMLYADDELKFEDCLTRFYGLDEAFGVSSMHPGIVISVLLAAAQGYASQGKLEQALEMLEKYSTLVTSSHYPFTLHGNSFFDQLDDWFNDFDLGTEMPRSKEVIIQSIIDSVDKNPLFVGLAEDMKFKNIVKKLKRIEGE